MRLRPTTRPTAGRGGSLRPKGRFRIEAKAPPTNSVHSVSRAFPTKDLEDAPISAADLVIEHDAGSKCRVGISTHPWSIRDCGRIIDSRRRDSGQRPSRKQTQILHHKPWGERLKDVMVDTSRHPRPGSLKVAFALKYLRILSADLACRPLFATIFSPRSETAFDGMSRRHANLYPIRKIQDAERNNASLRGCLRGQGHLASHRYRYC